MKNEDEERDVERFATYLCRLRDDENRAALAHLRRGIGKTVGECAQRDAWIFRCPGGVPEKIEDAAATVASLFAMHTSGGGVGGMGRAFARLRDGGASESTEKRFVALLNADREDLDNHLRHAVSLLKSKNIPVDWRQLLLDILDWNRQKRPVQRRWSHEFWVPRERLEADTGNTASESNVQSTAM